MSREATDQPQTEAPEVPAETRTSAGRIVVVLAVVAVAAVASMQALLLTPETAMHQIYQVGWFTVASVWWLIVAVVAKS